MTTLTRVRDGCASKDRALLRVAPTSAPAPASTVDGSRDPMCRFPLPLPLPLPLASPAQASRARQQPQAPRRQWIITRAVALVQEPSHRGSGQPTGRPAPATADLLAEYPDATIAALGDLAYQEGTLAQFEDCYEASWGRFKDRTRPATGNHDHSTTNAQGYWGILRLERRAL
jgi:hypothetical protein